MLGFSSPIASKPLASASFGSVGVTASAGALTFTTFDATVSAGSSTSVGGGVGGFSSGYSSGFGTGTGISGFSSGFSSGFGIPSSTSIPIIVFSTFDATVSTGGRVDADTGALTFTTFDALIQAAGAILATTDALTFTTFDAEIRTAGFVYPDTGLLNFTTFPATIATPGAVFADSGLLQFIEYGADISTSGLVEASNTAFINFTTFDFNVKIGRNPKLYKESQKFSPSNLVVLYELDATAIGGEYMRFTSSANENDVIRFNGNPYFPIPVEANGFDVSGQGTLPTPSLRILNTPTLQSGIITLNDLLGCVFYRIRTFRAFLDDGDDPDGNAKFPVDIYKIERKVSQTKVFVEWELSAAMDQEGKVIPGRQIIRDFCTHIYRVWNPETEDFDYTRATCPYVGSSHFNESDTSVNSSEDRCGKRLSSCKARFGNNAQLPTRAFPGVAKVR